MVLKKCVDIIVDHLVYIFKAVFFLNVYYPNWLESTMLVLHKPDKLAYNYNAAKAYRPIGLLHTIGKLLSTMVAADLLHLAEKHSLLPVNQFGGQLGHNTTDMMHLVVSRIEDAWQKGQVASMLFLDV